METRQIVPSDVAFTPSVKAVQSRRGSRQAYSRLEQGDGWESAISDELKAFVEAQTSVFLATASAQGQPYVQHRGGPAGFLRVLDAHTIGFVDFAGNRQFISTGNLLENPRAQLFLIDYARRYRVKIWGTARVIEGDAGLMAALLPLHSAARAEQVILMTVSAWDVNCPQHIPILLPATQVEGLLAARDRRIAVLEAELQRLRTATS